MVGKNNNYKHIRYKIKAKQNKINIQDIKINKNPNKIKIRDIKRY